MKPKVAFFDFTGCEGCQLVKVNLEEEVLALLELVEIVNFREAISDNRHDYDIAFIEGSISSPECVERINHIRSKAKILVAVGACATTGGVNAIRNNMHMDKVRKEVYGDDRYLFPTLPLKAVSEVVPVDFEVRGCPMDKEEYLKLVKALVIGATYYPPNYAVCVECKLKENECAFNRGDVCMGPITRAGCGARCPSVGYRCFGCRGFVTEPNVNGEIEVFKNHGLSLEEAMKRMQTFNTNREG